MATKYTMQVPVILEVNKTTIRIQHPDISAYPRTRVSAPIAAAGVTLTVQDNNGFADNDWFIIGEVGDPKTEEDDVNGAVTLGTSMTVTNTLKFSHEIDAPVNLIYERQFKIYGAATDGGVGTVIAGTTAGLSIQWDRPYSEYTLKTTDTTYAYYYAVFYDGTTTSSASAYVASTGLGYTTVQEVAEDALRKVNAEIDEEPNGLITRDFLVQACNDFQDEVSHCVTSDGVPKDWSFEIFEETTTIPIVQNTTDYLLSGLTADLKYDDTFDSILNVRIGSNILKYKDIERYDKDMEDVATTTLASDSLAAAVTLTLTDSYEFSESGTAYIGSDAFTYTANAESTGILSGIPASGSGYLASAHTAGVQVWQGITPGTPESYTVFDGYIKLDTPPDSDWTGYKLKIRGLKKLDRLTTFGSSLQVPFTYLAKKYVGAQIEYRKGNDTQAARLMAEFKDGLEREARRDKVQTMEQMNYYSFDFDDNTDDDDN